jgi:putative ABC transport system permease protein
MIRHAFKLIWNRRRANGLILVELLISFLVLSGILTMVCKYADSWRQPLGFDYHDVWRLDIVNVDFWMMINEQRAEARELTDLMEQALRDLDPVVAVTPFTYNHPFTRGSAGQTTYIRGEQTMVQHCPVKPEAMEVLDLELVAGRWIEPGDELLGWVPNVISRNFARDMYGDEDPIGQTVRYLEADGTVEEPDEGDLEQRIVGIVADYKRYGEPTPAPYVAFMPDPEPGGGPMPPRSFLLRVREGTTAAFEERVIQTARHVAPGWTLTVTALETERADRIRDELLPLLITSIVAGFLIVMVGMGLVGVLWQSVTRRTRELGLRRALGATGGDIRGQVLVELAALATVAVVIGTLIYVQFPILDLAGNIDSHVFALALGLTIAIIYLFVVLCGLYPSWLATRVDPVRALQHE